MKVVKEGYISNCSQIPRVKMSLLKPLRNVQHGYEEHKWHRTHPYDLKFPIPKIKIFTKEKKIIKHTQTINIIARSKQQEKCCFTNFNPKNNPPSKSVNHKKSNNTGSSVNLQKLTCKGDIQPKHKQDKQTGSEIHASSKSNIPCTNSHMKCDED